MAWKRPFDILLALAIGVLAAPIGLAIAAWMAARGERPIFYVSERMAAVDRAFRLIKFRTMRPPAEGEADEGVSGGDKDGRITPLGRFLRRHRLDELPQLWNVLRGDMSFVGPRPPLRRYVERDPELYAEVLRSKPGVTGLASLAFHAREEALLRDASTPEETERIYVERCIPIKARLDLIYRRRASLALDLAILARTALAMTPFAKQMGRRRSNDRRTVTNRWGAGDRTARDAPLGGSA